MRDILIEIINNYGYMGIFLLILVENLFPPIPSEVVLLFGGFLTLHTEMALPVVIAFATAGSLGGAAILYMLGRLLTKERLTRLVSSNVGKSLHLKYSHLDMARKFFVRYQSAAVLVCRCVPIVRSLISIPAGAAKMSPPLFFVLTFIGSSIWNSVLILLGAFLGDAWQNSMYYLDIFTIVAFVALVIVCIVLFIKFFRRNS
ncbi:MAG: DedA family protein [Eubacteriales bacterium]|nr:DedA family protein [Eubacteriales bacterium]MDD4389252.1 DedA family protein [Eubacteriales bacterium]